MSEHMHGNLPCLNKDCPVNLKSEIIALRQELEKFHQGEDHTGSQLRKTQAELALARAQIGEKDAALQHSLEQLFRSESGEPFGTRGRVAIELIKKALTSSGQSTLDLIGECEKAFRNIIKADDGDAKREVIALEALDRIAKWRKG